MKRAATGVRFTARRPAPSERMLGPFSDAAAASRSPFCAACRAPDHGLSVDAIRTHRSELLIMQIDVNFFGYIHQALHADQHGSSGGSNALFD